MRRLGWALLALLALGTLALVMWALFADPDVAAPADLAVAAEPEPEPPPAPLRPAAPPPPTPSRRPLPSPQPAQVAAAPALAEQTDVRGQVLDPEGQPVAFAQIVRADQPEQAVGVSDPTGHFVLAVQGAPRAVIAVHERFAASNVEPLRLTPDGSWTIRLQSGGALQGRVLGADGQPVPRATVSIERAEHDGPALPVRRMTPPVQCNEAGVFEFGPLRPGSYDLRADADGRAPGFARSLRVAVAGRQTGIDIRLAAGATVRGRVTSKQTGQPVAGAMVMLMDFGPGTAPRSATTDADGRYQLAMVAPGRHSLRVDHPEHRSELASGLDLPDGGDLVRDVALAAKVAGERFSFQGIGATLMRDGQGVVVRGIMAGTPAEQAGVREGDRILSVDRSAVSSMPLPQVVERIRGEEGSSVLLEIERPGQGRFTVQVNRGQVVVKDPPEGTPPGHP